MDTASFEELKKLPHLNAAAFDGRVIQLLPVWNGEQWKFWIPGPAGRLAEIQIVDAAKSLYLTKVKPAAESDASIYLLEFIWQRLTFRELVGLIAAMEDDFHLLATSAAKLEHFHLSRGTIDEGLLASFVRSEIEYVLIVCRSVFDLFQEIVSRFWNNHVRLLIDAEDSTKNRNKLPPTFSKIVFHQGRQQTADEIVAKYALPTAVARQYVTHTPFFESLRVARDRIIHGSASVGTIFVTDMGFAVSPTSKPFDAYPWQQKHYYNENIVSLTPWVAHIVLTTIQSLTQMIAALSSTIQFPEELAPTYRVLLRDPSNSALLRLLEATE